MEVTKYITFDMAHRLPNHFSRCKNIHGHSWKIGVTLESDTLASDSSEGMVFDFKDLKSWLMEVVDERFDHSMTLFLDDPFTLTFVNMLGISQKNYDEAIEWLKNNPELEVVNFKDVRFNITNFIPTSENLAKYFKKEFEQRLYSKLKDNPKYTNVVKIKHIELWETANSRCIC